MVETLFLFMLTIVITSAKNDNKAYSEDDVYISNSSTTYSNIPTECNLFGNEFEADYPVQKININIKENGTYWIGAKIGFKRNINPLGVRNVCKNNQTGTLEECNRHCKGQKYFSYNEDSCSCLKSNHSDVGLSKTKICKHPENGLCFEHNCLVYERDVITGDYLCDVYYYESIIKDWVFTTKNCSIQLNFICDGDNPSSDAMKTSWLVAEQTCSKKGKHLLQMTKILGNEFEDGTNYWVSFFRRKKISWGKGGDKNVCAALTIFPNGSVSLVSRFCTDQLATLCYTHQFHGDHQNTSGNDATVPIIVVSALAFLLIAAVLVSITVCYRRKKTRNLKTFNIQQNQIIAENNVSSACSVHTEVMKNDMTDVGIIKTKEDEDENKTINLKTAASIEQDNKYESISTNRNSIEHIYESESIPSNQYESLTKQMELDKHTYASTEHALPQDINTSVKQEYEGCNNYESLSTNRNSVEHAYESEIIHANQYEPLTHKPEFEEHTYDSPELASHTSTESDVNQYQSLTKPPESDTHVYASTVPYSEEL